ncbi:MAG TPA: hypothetical protein VKR31_04010 [Rhizomicrobium sp.]|nr:hypothetical protein [Rhizomicrobium sp.]
MKFRWPWRRRGLFQRADESNKTYQAALDRAEGAIQKELLSEAANILDLLDRLRRFGWRLESFGEYTNASIVNRAFDQILYLALREAQLEECLREFRNEADAYSWPEIRDPDSPFAELMEEADVLVGPNPHG